MNIGKSIKKVRTMKGISQGEFAAMCGISQTSISQIEQGNKRPNPTNLKKICKVLDVPERALYLIGLEESDVKENYKELYKTIYPNIEAMVLKLVTGDA